MRCLPAPAKRKSVMVDMETATGWPKTKRIVVVAMKPQIRGRIRRNIMTFLELGAEVVIVNSTPRDDFLVGLQHPNLSVHFLDPQSLAVRYNSWVSAQNQKRQARWDASKTTAYKGSAPVQGAPRPVRSELPDDTGGRLKRTSQETSRWRRALRRQRNRAQKWGVRQARTFRKYRNQRIRAVVRPLHRVNRFLEFWLLSAKYIRGLAPDLVVSSDLPGLVGANVAARHLHRPHLHDCHELYLESTSFKTYEKCLLRPIESWFMRRADSVVVVNRTIRDVYQQRYSVQGTVLRNCGAAVPQSVLENPMDLHDMLGIPPEASIVLYQGGLAEGRGLEVLVAATSEFPVGIHTVLVGSGRERESLERQVSELGVEDRVHFIPAVLPHELPAYTAAATLGVIPYQPVSANNAMALPNKVFEYTGAGIPFVASDLPELRRIAEEAGCAAVYDPFNPRELAQTITDVLGRDKYATYRSAAVSFGQRNTWENEKLILISEAERLAGSFATAAFHDSSASTGGVHSADT
ncbi:glycosyltransferase [Nesterenkonia sphaerica]|nr:glycosyltransferase [Nesterenkonia sphaerica]